MVYYLTWASSSMDFLMSVILQRIIRQPFLIVITAFLLNTIVSPLKERKTRNIPYQTQCNTVQYSAKT